MSIWLKPDVEVLLARVRKKSNRPLLQTVDPEQTLRRILEERSPTYALADITIESRDGPHESVVETSAAPPRGATLPLAGPCTGESAKGRGSARRARLFDRHRPGRDRRGRRGDRADCRRGQVRRRHRRACRAALSRQADAKPRLGRPCFGLDRLPAGRGNEILRTVRARVGRADRGAHRTPRHRHRAGRRSDRRPDRILRRLVASRRTVRTGSHHAPVAGRFERGRQDRHKFAARQEPGRGVPPAVPRPCRLRQPSTR